MNKFNYFDTDLRLTYCEHDVRVVYDFLSLSIRYAKEDKDLDLARTVHWDEGIFNLDTLLDAEKSVKAFIDALRNDDILKESPEFLASVNASLNLVYKVIESAIVIIDRMFSIDLQGKYNFIVAIEKMENLFNDICKISPRLKPVL